MDVQVFATTHSRDCIDAIAQLYREEPGLADDITVHRIEANKPETIRMTAKVIDTAERSQLEVR